MIRTSKLLAVVMLTTFTIACNKKDDTTATPTTTPSSSSGTFTLTSEAVADGELLSAYKCETKVNDVEQSIPLAWSNVPEGTGSLAIIMHHYPNPDDHSHVSQYLLLWNISPDVTSIAHGAADDGPWYMGSNKDGTAISYTSPCSQGSGTHEYTITIYALDKTPAMLPAESSLSVDYATLKSAIATVSVLGTAELIFKDVTP